MLPKLLITILLIAPGFVSGRYLVSEGFDIELSNQGSYGFNYVLAYHKEERGNVWGFALPSLRNDVRPSKHRALGIGLYSLGENENLYSKVYLESSLFGFWEHMPLIAYWPLGRLRGQVGLLSNMNASGELMYSGRLSTKLFQTNRYKKRMIRFNGYYEIVLDGNLQSIHQYGIRSRFLLYRKRRVWKRNEF